MNPLTSLVSLARRSLPPHTVHATARAAVRAFAVGTLALTALAGAAGCSTSARLETPGGFATLGKDTTYAYRATSARGVVLATRTEKNDLHGNTEFWAESIDLKLSRAGYVKRSESTVRARGLEGRQLRYTLERNAREQRYWVTVFVSGEKVVVVEAAGDAVHFAQAEPTVERAIASLKID